MLESNEAAYIYLGIFAVLMSLVGAFYYLRIVKLMYLMPLRPHKRRWVSMPSRGQVGLGPEWFEFAGLWFGAEWTDGSVRPGDHGTIGLTQALISHEQCKRCLVVIVLAVTAANLPFLNNRWLGFCLVAVRLKKVWHCACWSWCCFIRGGRCWLGA